MPLGSRGRGWPTAQRLPACAQGLRPQRCVHYHRHMPRRSSAFAWGLALLLSSFAWLYAPGDVAVPGVAVASGQMRQASGEWTALDGAVLATWPGPYELRWQLKLAQDEQALGLRLALRGAAELFCDGQLVLRSGRPGRTAAEEVPGPIDRWLALPLAESARDLWSYPYHWHAVRLQIILASTLLAAWLLPLSLALRWGWPQRLAPWRVGWGFGLALVVAIALPVAGYDVASWWLHLAGLSAALGLAWRARRQRSAPVPALLTLLCLAYAWLWLDPAAFLDGLYTVTLAMVMMLLMPLLAVALAVPPKRSSSALGVFVSVVLVVVYYKVSEYAAGVSALGLVDPFIGLWGPFAVFSALIVWLERVAGKAIKAVRSLFGSR